MHNERFEELAAVHALGIPLEEESADFARHRKEGCSVCEELLSDFSAAAAALAIEAPPREPSPRVRDRILRSIRPAPGTPAPAPSSVAPWLLAAAAALVLAILTFDDARLRREREELASRAADLTARLSDARAEISRKALQARVLESDDVRILFLGGKDPQPDARARVFWSEKARRGILVAGNLASLPPDKQYELWVFIEGKPVPAGVFDADSSGRALFESPSLASLPAAQNFAVTVEPRGGVPAPTGPIVLLGTPSA